MQQESPVLSLKMPCFATALVQQQQQQSWRITSDDERYIVNLVERVVRVSVETAQIVRGLAAHMAQFAPSAPDGERQS